MLKNNKINLIISIVVAIAIWAYVVVEINPDETKTVTHVPVTMTNVNSLHERGLALAKNEKYTVNVSVRGPRSKITQVNAGDIKATANLFGYPEGKNDIRVMVNAPSGLSVEDINPTFITIEVNRSITASKPVKIKYVGKFADNTDPELISNVPKTMEISGASSIVDTVSYIELTIKTGDIKDMATTIQSKSVAVNGNGNVVSGINLAHEKVAVKLVLTHIKTVPLRVAINGTVDPAYAVTSEEIPKEVTLRGIKAQLDKINYVEADPVDISNITKTTDIPLKFNLPGTVKLAKASQNMAITIGIGGA